MQRIIFIGILFSVAFHVSFSQQKPLMRYEDKIRIREAITISIRAGDDIWKGINKTPFVVLLVTDSIEFLVNHPYPSTDFKLSENDSVLKTDIFYRPRQYPVWFLATFPAISGVNCTIVGIPENTQKNSTDWIITLLHEHFHQYQFTSDGYYKSVEDLGLSGGDQTGMWQLNYPFPYDSANVVAQYDKYVQALSRAVASRDQKSFGKNFKEYRIERNKFKKLLKPEDYRYFSFQIWQEGLARYTEFKFLSALNNYKPSQEASQLPDFILFSKYKEQLYTSQIQQLNTLKLPVDKRVCFYAIGLAEGLLLDKLNTAWRDSYLADKFYIEKYSKRYQ